MQRIHPLHTISAPASGPEMEMDVRGVRESFLGPHHYGRVMYVHGGGIDQPVAVGAQRVQRLAGGGHGVPAGEPPGQYDMGVSTCVLVTPRSPVLAEHGGEQQIGADTTTHQIGDTRARRARGLAGPQLLSGVTRPALSA